MKALAQKPRKTTARNRRASGKSMQARARSGAGNRHRADVFERQADDLAGRIMHGESNVATRVSRAPAARLRGVQSAGRRLPSGLHREMEIALGANLDAVRIHTGTAADTTAREYDADALTSGRDVYFRSGQYAPYTNSGRNLIAHELVHVLQQSGRTMTGGLLAATVVDGTADVQTKRTSPLTSSTTIPTFDEINERHAKESPKDAALAKKIKQIKKERDDAVKAGRLEGYWDDLQTHVRSSPEEYSKLTSSIALRSYVYDVLKFAKRWDGAVHLLERDFDLRSTYFASEVFDVFPEGTVPGETNVDYNDIFGSIWNTHPFFEKFRPKRFNTSISDYLIGPTRAIPDLDAQNAKFDQLTKDKLAERATPTALIDNELFFVTVDVVRKVDTIRTQKLAEVAKLVARGKASNELTPKERLLAAGEFAKWAKALTANSSRSPEVDRTLLALGPSMVSTAEGAVSFWQIAANLHSLSEKDVRLKDIGDVRAAFKKFATKPEVEKLGENVVEQSKELFKLDVEGNPISAEAYALACKNFIAKLREKLFDRFELPMLRAANSDKKGDILNSLLYGWLLYAIYELVELLAKYDPAEDARVLAEYVKISPDYKGADVRIRHRIELANFLSRLGFYLNWTKLQPIVDGVFVPAAGQKTLLAIFSDFSPDPMADLDKLTKDLSGGAPIIGGELLTTGDIRMFFYLQRYKAISTDLQKALDAEKDKPGSQSYGMVKHAIEMADKLPEPTRHLAGDYYAAVRVEDREVFSRLIREHPKFLALRQKLMAGGTTPILLIPARFTGDDLVVWALPSLASIGELIKRFQTVKEYNESIYFHESFKAGIPAVEHPDVSSIAMRPWAKWLQDFLAAVEFEYPWLDPSLDPETRQFIMEQELEYLKAGSGVKSKLREETENERLKMVELLRKASIFDRSTKSKELNILLGEYERYDQFSPGTESKILRYIIPDRVIDEITFAVHLTAPKEEQFLHQTALILELTDTMADKFQAAPRLDVMISYLPLMEDAISVARNKADQLNAVLTEEEKKTGWVERRLTKLEPLARLFHALEQKQQLEFGLQGVVAGGEKYLVGVGEGYVIKPGEQFTIDGIEYNLIDVNANFIYHPRHGNESPVLTDGNENPLKLSTPLVTVRYGDSTKAQTIKGSDEEDLTRLSNAVTLEGIVRQLNDLAVFIKGAAELTMDLVELIPGPGQALMAARLAVSVIQFIASDEFAILVDYVTNNPVEALEKFGKEILILLKPEKLWEYLFFGNNAFDQLHATKEIPKKAKIPRTITEKMTRVIMRLYNFGKGVIGSLGRLQTHARWRAESLEMFVLGRPTLTWLMQKIADNIDYIAGLVGNAAELADTVDDYRKKGEAALKEWPERVTETVDAIRKFQLPDKIIPMADIVEIVISMVLKRLPLKFRLASQVIMFLLEKFGKAQALYDAIGEGVEKIGIDPNIAWRGVRDTYIKKPFQDARNELAYTIFDFFGQIQSTIALGPGEFALMTPEQQRMFQDKAKEVQQDKTFEVGEINVEEWEAYAPSGLQRGLVASSPLESNGKKLPEQIRRPAEIGFGQNLSHVRLHTGDAASRFTGSVGAKALAGGSHVFLGNDVNPSTPHGRWVLNHELAHVVHQTGPRSQNRQANDLPTPIPRGRGIIQDPTSESFASRAADRMSSRRSVGAAPSPSAVPGFHPFGLIDVTRRLLNTLAGTTDLEKDEKKEEATGGTTGLKKLPPNIKKQIDKLWEGFSAAINNSTMTTFEAPFNSKDVKDGIISLLTNKADTEHAAKAIEDALDDLAIDSFRERKEASTEKGKPPKIVYELDIDRLEIALSRFVFAKSGILMKIKLLSGIFTADPSKAKDAPPTFVSLNVVYVHLAEIHGNHKLWQMAVDKVLAGKEHEKYIPRIRTYLAAKGPSLGTWEKTTYQLTKKVIDDVEAIMAAIGTTLDKAKLPPPVEYLAAKTPTGAAENIGLRLGVYGDPEQNGPERESHHITQYLLLEYFHGSSDDKPFPLLKKNLKAYPGISASGSGEDAKANTVTAPSAPKAIDLAGWESGRGGKMPAILISAPTHRSGRLHVTTKADDWATKGNKATAPDSPSGVVHMKFREFLDDRDDRYLKAQKKSEGTETSKTQETFPAYVARTEGATRGGVQKVIYNAMQDTYHWMRDFMQPRLETALVAVEMKYYNTLGQGKSYEITSSQMSHVYAKAVIKNKDEMEKGGWY